ncbi:hypothetical protein [Halorarius litoreus]|uniref:hypothetical protein n=1 Tax=Halorarius litoreus TaxID=2962676 RepID=UPI0020CCFA25|nr:hypothetical protein [Halorarius litoreus]
MTVIESAFVFIISFIIGTIGIYVGARIITETESFGKAAVTALIGAIVWVVVAFLFGWIPLLGPLLALIAYVGVVNWQYPAGWGSAAVISLIAWITSIIILYALALVGFVQFSAFGVPGA